MHATRGDDLRHITIEEAVRALAHVLATAKKEGVPPLTPERWKQMDCRRGELVQVGTHEGEPVHRTEARRATFAAWKLAGCSPRVLRCQCFACVTEERVAPERDQAETEAAIRPHRRHACEFGSCNAALEFLLRWRQDGAGARSSAGAIVSRLSEAARLGTAVQTTERYDREELSTRRATMAADLERMLARAFAEEAERRGLEVATCCEIVLSTVDAQRRCSYEAWAERTGLSLSALRALVAHGRRVFERLAADEQYIPEPRAKRGRLTGRRVWREEEA